MIWLRLRTELRATWRTLLVLVIFVGIGGGVALAAFSGARRADTATSRLLDFSLPDDGGFIFGSPSSLPPVPASAANSLAPFGAAKKIVELPQVASWFRSAYLFLATSPTPSSAGNLNFFGAANKSLFHSVDRPYVVAGRMADPSRPFEVMINELAAEVRHLHVGSRIPLYSPSYAQIQSANFTGLTNGFNSVSTGPRFTAKVTGIIRFPSDVSAILPIAAQQDVDYEGQQNVYLTPAFLIRLASGLNVPVESIPGLQFFAVRLQHGVADWKAFSSAATAIGQGQVFASAGNVNGFRTAAASAQRGIHVEVIALLLFGGLALLVTMLLVGQAVTRKVVVEALDFATLRSLGVTRGQLVAIVMLRAGVIGFAGGLVALVVAFLGSPLLPVGLARQAEIQPGFAFNVAILVPGALVVGLLICARSIVPAWRASRRPALEADEGTRRTRASWADRTISSSGVPPAAAIGVSYGIRSGFGSRAVPIATALQSAIVAVMALATSFTFSKSLDHLIASPREQGWNWDVLVGNPNDLTDREAEAQALLSHNRFVSSYSAISILAGASQGNVVIEGKVVDTLLAFDPMKGDVHPALLTGRPPRAGDEIVLGTKTSEQLHKGIGQSVVVRAPGGNFRLRIVGTMLSPSIGDLFTNGIGDGGWVYGPAVRQQAQAQQQTQSSQSSVPPTVFNLFAVRYAPGVSHSAAYASLRRQFGGTVLRDIPAEDVVNLKSVDRLPLLLAGLVALLGAMTVGNTLVTSLRRRRHDLAILKTIGFDGHQVAAVVAWQATSFALVSLVVGLPLGVAAGRWSWDLAASGIGSTSPALVPVYAVGLIIPATIVVANAIAGVPGWAAARIRPATALRSE